MLSKLVWQVRRLFGVKYGKLSLDAAAREVGKPGVCFIDVNPPDRYAQGHVPGATNVARDQVTAGDLPSDKNAPLIFYCGSSM
jgi:rhodanese-related sulfurtransferase